MKKYKQVGMKKKKIYLNQKKMTLQQVIIMTLDKRNFQVLHKYLFKEKKMMFHDTALHDSPSPQRITSASMWTRMFMRARKETSAPSTRGLRLRQRRVHIRREQLPALSLSEDGTSTSEKPDRVRPVRIRKKLSKFS